MKRLLRFPFLMISYFSFVALVISSSSALAQGEPLYPGDKQPLILVPDSDQPEIQNQNPVSESAPAAGSIPDSEEGVQKSELAPAVQAKPKKVDNEFTPFHWTPGLHLLSGFGVNASVYTSDDQPDVFGGGMNLHTDVGYFFSNNFAFEVNATVMFNQIRGMLIWDTVGLFGIRYRIDAFKERKNLAPYGRLLVGSNVSVLLGDTPPEQDIGGDRTHIQGQAVGIGFGAFQKATSGNTWFMEILAIAQDYRKVEAVTVVDEVPVVVNSRHLGNNSKMFALTLTFGIVAF